MSQHLENINAESLLGQHPIHANEPVLLAETAGQPVMGPLPIIPIVLGVGATGANTAGHQAAASHEKAENHGAEEYDPENDAELEELEQDEGYTELS